MKEINKDAMFEAFGDYPWNGNRLSIYELAMEVLKRYYLFDEDERQNDWSGCLMRAMDDELVWTTYKWTMVETYCDPESTSYEGAWECFYDDLAKVVNATGL